MFAVDQQCSKVYYFTEDKGWAQYISARNISCSAHGNEGIHVEESVCLQGSVKNSNSSFLYMPFGNTKVRDEATKYPSRYLGRRYHSCTLHNESMILKHFLQFRSK